MSVAAWSSRRLKFLASITPSSVDKKTEDGERAVRLCNYTDVYRNDLIVEDMDFMEATASEEEVRRFQLRAGDVIVTKDSETWEDIAVPAYVPNDLPSVVCGYHLSLLRPDQHVADGKYLFYVFRAPVIAERLHIEAQGVTRFALNSDALASAVFPMPPLAVQRAIAAFLDRKTAEIDALIAKKQRLLELLEEKRTALITQAVTKGIAPGVEMSETGVEWFDAVPAHWEVCPLGKKWGVIDCKHKTVPFVDEGIPLASIGEVSGLVIDLRSAKRTTEDQYRSMIEGERDPRIGDVIYSRNATVGSAALVSSDERFCMGQDVSLIRSEHQRGDYLLFLLRSPAVLGQLDAHSIGSTIKRINVSRILSLVVCVPPRAEQDAIAEHCWHLHRRISALREGIASALSLLREYRTALITAAVTGQIEVPVS